MNNEGMLTRMRANPWMLSSIVLGVLLVGTFVFGGVGTIGDNGSISANVVVSEEDVGGKILEFLNSQVNEEVELSAINKKEDYYEVIVNYQGDLIPLYASLSGDYIFTDLVPTDGSDIAGQELGDPGQEAVGGQKVEVEIGDSPVKGDANAPVTIVEFSDYECPFCGRFYSDTLSQIDKEYIQTGKVKLVFKDFPLSFHPNAQLAAEAVRCVRDDLGDEGYYDMHDKLFENQNRLSRSDLEAFANELGVDISGCLDVGTHTDAVQSDFAYGASVGITGTPGFIINGIPVSGAQPFTVFEQIIEQELAVQ
jgi:protein-disulfide isomerase